MTSAGLKAIISIFTINQQYYNIYNETIKSIGNFPTSVLGIVSIDVESAINVYKLFIEY